MILENINISGILLHIGGLNSAFENISFWGHGIGSAGNYSIMFSASNQSLLGISDTYIGALIGQIGIFGTFLWILLGFVIILSPKSERASKILSLKLFFSIFGVSILSENTMNVTSFLLPAIIIGLSINTHKKYLK